MGLDVDKFFDFVTKEQKTSFLIPFATSLPVAYTILFLCVDGYADYAFFERVIFVIAAVIVVMSLFGIVAIIDAGYDKMAAGCNIACWFWFISGGNCLLRFAIGWDTSTKDLLLVLVGCLLGILTAAIITRPKRKHKQEDA